MTSELKAIELVLTQAERDRACAILNRYAPGCRAFVFGSRVVRCADDYRRIKTHSDLDIALTGPALTLAQMDDMREAFSQSDLPMRVDIAHVEDLPAEWKKRAWPL